MNKSDALKALELPDYNRGDLLAALAIEMPHHLDSRMFTSARGLTMMAKAGLQHLSKNASTGTAVLIAQHPLTAMFVGSVAAIGLGSGGIFKYKDYSKDFEDTFLALGFLTHASPDAIATLNMSVAGALDQFLKNIIILQFIERADALRAISLENAGDPEVADRYRIYAAGLSQAQLIQVELQTVLQVREQERRDYLTHHAATLGQTQQSLDQSRENVETRYKAGLISHEDYTKRKATLFSEGMKLKGRKLLNITSALTKTEVPSESSEKELVHFYRAICKPPPPPAPRFVAPINRQAQMQDSRRQSVWVKLAVAVAICSVVFLGARALLS